VRPLLPSDEVDIIHKVTQGDQKAFSELFYRYHQSLGGYVFSLTKSHVLTEEIVQDTFVKIWQQRHTLPTISSFKAFLFTVSKHHTLNTMRNELRKAERLEEWLSEQNENQPEVNEVHYQLLDQAIDQLPTQQKKAWLLSRHEGLKQEEIAQQLHLSRETVKRHLSLATTSITRFIQLKSSTLSLIFLFLTAQIVKQLPLF
jgi:RNA polymerase sigma-70 factor (ECF subfamily)